MTTKIIPSAYAVVEFTMADFDDFVANLKANGFADMDHTRDEMAQKNRPCFCLSCLDIGRADWHLYTIADYAIFRYRQGSFTIDASFRRAIGCATLDDFGECVKMLEQCGHTFPAYIDSGDRHILLETPLKTCVSTTGYHIIRAEYYLDFYYKNMAAGAAAVTKQCVCDINTIMATGCRCGGV